MTRAAEELENVIHKRSSEERDLQRALLAGTLVRKMATEGSSSPPGTADVAGSLRSRGGLDQI